MRLLIITTCLLLFFTTISAQQNYDVSLISKELMPYATAIIRNSETTIEVKDLNNVNYHIVKAITVLNKNGDNRGRLVVEYDKITELKSIKGSIYNSFGKQISKFSKSDCEDFSNAHDFSLFEDARVKVYTPAVTEYPYTIVYDYEYRSKETLDIGSWEPVEHTGVAVEKSSFTFICKQDFNINYKAENISDKPFISTDSHGLKTYTWQLNNQKAIRNEPFSPYHNSFLPRIQLAPQNFTYYGIGGTYNSWADLGKWEYNNLIANRQDLDPATVQHIKEITKDIADPKLKAKRVYEYMQNKTHYISVQVGIGGIQPFLAADVDRQNYGDCKALVNYTQALLKAIDINSYYCIVQSDYDYAVGLQSDFASLGQGNHAILCIPFKNDTTWTDCTSQTLPFGYLGSFTDDRNVLACTPEGGKLLHTPKYTLKDNLKSRKANFVIDNTGAISGSMTTIFKGVDYEYRDELINEPRTEQNKMLQKIYPINNLLINKLDIKQEKTFTPSTTEDIMLQAKDYASLSDGKYYFLLNPVNRVEETPKEIRNRMNDVYIARGSTDEDEITYTIPAGYHLDKEPLNVSVEKPFGKFSALMVLVGNQLVYKRKLQFIDGTYIKDTYQDLVDFYQTIVDADSYTITLAKN
jgi:hypothetical protein